MSQLIRSFTLDFSRIEGCIMRVQIGFLAKVEPYG